MGRKIIVELPDTPETDRYNADPRVAIIDSFLIWLGEKESYRLLEIDDWGRDERVMLEYDFARRDIVSQHLGFNNDKMRAEQNNIEAITKHAISGLEV